jgi:hypothetical protein
MYVCCVLRHMLPFVGTVMVTNPAFTSGLKAQLGVSSMGQIPVEWCFCSMGLFPLVSTGERRSRSSCPMQFPHKHSGSASP